MFQVYGFRLPLYKKFIKITRFRKEGERGGGGGGWNCFDMTHFKDKNFLFFLNKF